LQPIIGHLLEIGYPIRGNIISYYSAYDQAFIYIAKDPVQEEITIPLEDIDFSSKLKLKCIVPDNTTNF